MSYKTINGKMVKDSKHIKYGGTIKHNTIDTPMGRAVIMTREGEAKKMLDIMRTDPLPHPVAANEVDLMNIQFNDNDAGWFVALLPAINNNGGIGAINPDMEFNKSILSKFQITRYNDMALLTTYCTWDFARKHYREVLDNFKIGLIGFSTEKHLHLLAENSANI